ncbi:hypothetical protein B0H14DRAFT_1163616 [Mycena olivaceomarginata]|nr:hypothetical protein B0H14DRAFT_1163616 [Mycena olivaceomarginata]
MRRQPTVFDDMANTTSINNALDVPTLPAIRVPQVNTGQTDAVNTVPTVLDIALPPLRRSNGGDEPAPLPTLRAARAPTPEPFDAEDEASFVLRENPYEQDIADGAFIEDTEHIQNPVAPQGGQATSGSSPFLTPSTDRSMIGQTMRSFESRPGTTTRAKATADTSTTALARTGSSSTIVTFDDVAPSELEIYTQSGLLPPTKGEKVAAHRIRGDENEVRIAAVLVAVQRRIGELEKKLNAQHGEVLTRIEDIIKTSPTTSTGTLASTVTTELTRVKAMTMEGRSAISNLTEAVNSLIDLPRDITKLSRTVQNMTRNEGTGSAQMASYNKSTDDDFPLASDTMPDNSPASTSNKRARPFAGFNDPTETKRQRTDEPSHTDVYLWNVDIDKASPMSIARRAMDELKMRDYMANIISVAHPRNTPKTVISIRFRCIAIAEEFIDRLRANPPATMAKLHAAKREVYEKKAMGASDKGNLPW